MTKENRRGAWAQTALAAAVAALCAGMHGNADAFQFDTGNENLQIHWDNTVRYNLGTRTEAQDRAILGNPNKDDGDRNFNKGSIVTNRVDLLTEFDIVYKEKVGARVSAAAWYDQAYSGRLDNTSVNTSNHLVNGVQALGLSDYTRRYHQGLSGEFLDAFVFGSVDLGSMPLTVRAGQHTVYWGESLMDPVHGIAYGQAPLDGIKAYSTPGTEVKELFLPLPQISAQLQVTPEFSLAGQYFLKWKPSRFPESGSYYMDIDPLLQGGESLIVPGLGTLTQGPSIAPKDRGEWGVAARWSPKWLDGTLGFYGRRFSDKLPQLILNLETGQYHTNYAGKIDLYGISLSKQIAGLSFGMDLNYRRNMPLNNEGAMVFSNAELPVPGETLAPRGKTMHGVFNIMGAISRTPVFDSASWVAELSWNRLLSVTSDPQDIFTGRPGYNEIDRVTRDYFGLGLKFTPKWFQVFPGADLSLPIAYSIGLSGNSAVLGGGNKHSGSYSIGLGLDLYSKYRFDLQYVDYIGRKTVEDGVAVKTPGNGALTDRGAVYLTFKTTF